MSGILRADNKATPVRHQVFWVSTAVMAAFLALSAWAVSSPVGSSPDDDYHNVSIWCGQGLRDDLCEVGPTQDQVLVPQPVFSNAFCFAAQPDKSADCEQSPEMVPTVRVNNIQKLYPEGYYWFMSWFATEDVNSSILTMRMVNALITVLALAVTIFALPRYLRRVPLLSILVSSVPLGIFIFSSINPSSWTVISVITFFSASVGLLSSTTTKQRLPFALISILSIVMGISARQDAPSYLLLAAVLASVLKLSLTSSSKAMKFTYLAAGIAAVMFVAWRYVYPLLSTLRGINFGVGETDSTWQSLMLNLIRLPDLFVGAFGTWGLGWLDTPSPSSVWAVTYGIYFAIIFSGIRFFNVRQALAASIALLALVIVPLQFLWSNSLSVGNIVQPRYLLPMLVLLAAVSVYRSRDDKDAVLSRGQLWLIGIGLFAANTIALHTNLRRYITGLDVNQVSLNFEMEWWWVDRPASSTLVWFSPNYLWVAGSVAFGVMLFSIWKLREKVSLFGDSAEPLVNYSVAAAHALIPAKEKKLTLRELLGQKPSR